MPRIALGRHFSTFIESFLSKYFADSKKTHTFATANEKQSNTLQTVP
jgi:hypothetical protein